MKLPQGAFVNVSGIDTNDGARIVFVWCRDKGPEDYALLGSGHVVGAVGCGRPPGVPAGQFSVTFLLPPGCSADDVFVTDDKTGKAHLPGVTVTPCLNVSGFQSEETVTPPGAPPVHAGVTDASPQPSHIVMARQRS